MIDISGINLFYLAVAGILTLYLNRQYIIIRVSDNKSLLRPIGMTRGCILFMFRSLACFHFTIHDEDLGQVTDPDLIRLPIMA